jgi:hypothetical protein
MLLLTETLPSVTQLPKSVKQKEPAIYRTANGAPTKHCAVQVAAGKVLFTLIHFMKFTLPFTHWKR